MSAKISGVANSPPASAPASSAGQRAAAISSQVPGATNTSDSVQITDTAAHLATAEQTLNDLPVINRGRVEEVSDSLASGTYQVSPKRIANQLLQFEWLLPDEEPAE